MEPSFLQGNTASEGVSMEPSFLCWWQQPGKGVEVRFSCESTCGSKQAVVLSSFTSMSR